MFGLAQVTNFTLCKARFAELEGVCKLHVKEKIERERERERERKKERENLHEEKERKLIYNVTKYTSVQCSDMDHVKGTLCLENNSKQVLPYIYFDVKYSILFLTERGKNQKEREREREMQFVLSLPVFFLLPSVFVSGSNFVKVSRFNWLHPCNHLLLDVQSYFTFWYNSLRNIKRHVFSVFHSVILSAVNVLHYSNWHRCKSRK